MSTFCRHVVSPGIRLEANPVLVFAVNEACRLATLVCDVTSFDVLPSFRGYLRKARPRETECHGVSSIHVFTPRERLFKFSTPTDEAKQ
jgi:hypothetical protein